MPIEYRPRSAVAIMFPLSIGIIFAVGGLLFFHIYLVVTANTTLELYKNMERRMEHRRLFKNNNWRNPFNEGFYGNFTQVLVRLDAHAVSIISPLHRFTALIVIGR